MIGLVLDNEHNLCEAESKSEQGIINSEVMMGDHGLEASVVRKNHWVREFHKG